MNQAEIDRISRFAKGGDLEKFWEAYQANPEQLFKADCSNPRKFSEFDWDGRASFYSIVEPARKMFVQVGTRPSVFTKGAIVTFSVCGSTISDLQTERASLEAGFITGPKITWHPIQVVEVPSE